MNDLDIPLVVPFLFCFSKKKLIILQSRMMSGGCQLVDAQTSSSTHASSSDTIRHEVIQIRNCTPPPAIDQLKWSLNPTIMSPSNPFLGQNGSDRK